jgi:hypothetical protein
VGMSPSAFIAWSIDIGGSEEWDQTDEKIAGLIDKLYEPAEDGGWYRERKLNEYGDELDAYECFEEATKDVDGVSYLSYGYHDYEAFALVLSRSYHIAWDWGSAVVNPELLVAPTPEEKVALLSAAEKLGVVVTEEDIKLTLFTEYS